MPEVCPEYPLARRSSQPFVQPMAVHLVGSRYCRPLPKAARNKRYLLVDTDYFTKWVEAEPLANIRVVDAKRFVRRNIVT